MGNEDYEFKEYFSELNLAQARLKFRMRSGCVKFCKVLYPSDKENLKSMFICPEDQCSSLDNVFHWSRCISYAPLRQSRNLLVESELIDYFQDIINLRSKELNKK